MFYRRKCIATVLVLAGVVCANRSVSKAERLDNHAEVRLTLEMWTPNLDLLSTP